MFSRGAGLLVFAIAVVCSLICNVIVDQLMGPGYYDVHKWPFGISQLLGAPLCWFIGRKINAQPAQRLIDVETGEVVTRNTVSDFLFIRMEHWGVLFVIFGLTAIAWSLVTGK